MPRDGDSTNMDGLIQRARNALTGLVSDMRGLRHEAEGVAENRQDDSEISGHNAGETHPDAATGSEAAATPSAANIGDQIPCDTRNAAVPSGSEGNPFTADLLPIGQPQADRLTETMFAAKPILRASPSAPFGLPEMEGRQQPTRSSAEPNGPASAAAPIDQPETDGRLTETSLCAEPSAAASPSESIAAGPKAKRRHKATRPAAKPSDGSSPCAPIGPASNGVAGDEGHRWCETQVSAALVATVKDLVRLQKMRKHCIKAQSRNDRAMDDLIVQFMGYHTGLTGHARKELFKRAGQIRISAEKGRIADIPIGVDDGQVPIEIVALAHTNAAGRKQWDEQRADTERKMESLARILPIWPFAKGVRGLGELGVAVLVGEAGIPLGDYRTVSGLWSRLGEASHNGMCQQRMIRELPYQQERHGQIWSFLHESLLRSQRAAEKDEDGKDPKKTGKPVAVPAHALGPYGEVYGRRKAHTMPRVEATAHLPDKITSNGKEFRNPDKWTMGRCDNDARRVMAKEVIKDLWIEWRRVTRAAA